MALSIDAPFLYWSVVLTGLIDSLFSFYREKEAFAMVQSGCSNPSKINPLHMFVRVICILNLMIITVFYFSGVVGSVYDLFVIATFVAGSLIFACDPLPPSDGKIKDWLKSFRSRGLKQLIPQNIKPWYKSVNKNPWLLKPRVFYNSFTLSTIIVFSPFLSEILPYFKGFLEYWLFALNMLNY